MFEKKIMRWWTLSQLLVEAPGGGGGALDFQMVGVCRWGLKTGPCHKPLGAQKIHPVIICLTKNFHIHTLFQNCTPRIPCPIGVLLSWQAKKKKKKKKGPRLPDRLDRRPVINNHKHCGLWNHDLDTMCYWLGWFGYPVLLVRLI